MKFYQLKKKITEAKVGNVEKSMLLFVKLLQKYIGQKLYRYGGENGIVQIKHGIGYLFLTDTGPAYQFNYINGAIESVIVWKKFQFKPGNYTIEFSGMSLAQAGKKLIKAIMNPKVGEYDLDESTKQSKDELTENKKRRTGPREFFSLINDNLQIGQDIASLNPDEIQILAHGLGVQVPSAVKSTRVEGTKGRNAKFDLRKLLAMEPTSASNQGDQMGPPLPDKQLRYHMTITPQDMETGSFLSPKDNKEVDKYARLFQGVVDNESRMGKEEDSVRLFEKMESLIKLVILGRQKSLIIYGGPGTGKTHSVKETLNDTGLEQNQDWFMVKGNITTAELYKNLFMHRNGRIIVFDDTDSIWGDNDTANILKAALDSHDERLISWNSQRTVNISKLSPERKEEFYQDLDQNIDKDPANPGKFPAEFIYDGRIIFISNLTQDKFDSAVLSRSMKIDMSLTSNQMFKRLRHLLPKLGANIEEVPIERKEEILQFLIDEYSSGSLKNNPTMRSFINAESVFLSGMTDWKELFHYTV